MNWKQIEARIRRIETLTSGFSREELQITKGQDPLYTLERNEYIQGLRDAIQALERARLALVKAKHRNLAKLNRGNP